MLDLDGVLVDFVKGAARLHNQPCPFTGTGFTDWYFNRYWNMPDLDLYKGMDREFWSGLEWTADGIELFRVVDKVFGHANTCILTSPPPTGDGCFDGKMAWIKNNLPVDYHKKFLVGPAKQFCASSTRVLIDDNDGNIEQFRYHGGLGILVPRPWNDNRDIKDAVGYVANQINNIF